ASRSASSHSISVCPVVAPWSPASGVSRRDYHPCVAAVNLVLLRKPHGGAPPVGAASSAGSCGLISSYDVIARTGGAIDFPTSSERSDPNATGPIDLATECAAGRIHTHEQPKRSAARLRVRPRRPWRARPEWRVPRRPPKQSGQQV